MKTVGRQYQRYMRMRVESVLELTHLLDYTMPGIKGLLKGWNETNGKDKLGDFAEEYWHYDKTTEQSEEQFIDGYRNWAKKKGYHQSQDKAVKIYALAKEGIPTVSSHTPSGQGVTRSRSHSDDDFNTDAGISNDPAGISGSPGDGWSGECPGAQADRRDWRRSGGSIAEKP